MSQILDGIPLLQSDAAGCFKVKELAGTNIEPGIRPVDVGRDRDAIHTQGAQGDAGEFSLPATDVRTQQSQGKEQAENRRQPTTQEGPFIA